MFDLIVWVLSAVVIIKCVAQVAIPEIPAQVVLSEALKSSAENTGTACQHACVLLARQYPDGLGEGAVFIGQTGAFELWDAKQAELVPACRVEPTSAREVALVLETLVDQRCHFAVKSGGHERTPGASNADAGVTIDLVRLDGIDLSEDTKTVTIGAGLRWADVYRAMERKNLMVLGGRIGDVGVGGLLLGGGISFYSNERGLACDSIVSYELVLPNTTVITVDQKSYPDLYRSLRGAGAANFGIVTSFTLETFPLRKPESIWSAQKLYQWHETDQLVVANHRIATEAMDLDLGIAVMNIFVCHPRHKLCYGVIQAQHTSHDSVDRWPEQLSDYSKIIGLPQTLHMQVSTMSNTTEKLAGSSPSGKYRTIYGTFTYRPSIELEQQVLRIFREEVETVHDMNGFLPGVIMHPFSRTMISKMHKHGGNIFHSISHGRQHSKDPLIVLNVSWQWSEKLDDDRSYAAYHRLMERMEAAAKALRVWHPYKYINYAEASQDVWHGYGGEAVIELKRLQRQIDPKGIFTKGGLAGGFFKLNKLELFEESASVLHPSSHLGHNRNEL